jgi:TadE-like protein
MSAAQAPTVRGGQCRGDGGSAVVEFSLVAVLLLMLLLGIAQVAIYLHVRNVTAASAAEGARYAANADADPGQGAERAGDILGRAVGPDTAARLRCTGDLEEGDGGVQLSAVRCAGALPVFFAPFGDVLPLDVTGHAVEEGTP